MSLRQYIVCLVVIMVGFSSCIFDDMEDCPSDCTVNFTFVYDYNQLYVDLFQEQVEYMHLYIYDARTEELVHAVEKSKNEMSTAQTIQVTLPYGDYWAVAWGNCDSDDYAITGPEKVSTLQVSLTRIDRQNMVTTNDFSSLFHATSTFSLSDETADVPMSLIKNTNKLHVIVKGIGARFLDSKSFDVHVLAQNSSYNHENSFNSDLFMLHYPDGPTYSPEEKGIVGSFGLMRLIKDDNIQISLSLKEIDDEGVVRFDWSVQRPLIPFIINSMHSRGDLGSRMGEDEYLDRYDEFTIVLVVQADENNELYLEEWDYISQPQELG